MDKVAGIVAICHMNEKYEKEKLIYNVFRGMQLLQHRGKAFWKVNSGHFKIEGDGSLPSYDLIYELLQKQKNKVLNTAIGYLSKKNRSTKCSRESILLQMVFL